MNLILVFIIITGKGTELTIEISLYNVAVVLLNCCLIKLILFIKRFISYKLFTLFSLGVSVL